MKTVITTGLPLPEMPHLPYNAGTAPWFELRSRAMFILFAGGMSKADIARLFRINGTTVDGIIGRQARLRERAKRLAWLGPDAPQRVRTMCDDLGIKALIELQAMSEAELLRYPNFGRKSLRWLKEKGLWPAPKYSGCHRVE